MKRTLRSGGSAVNHDMASDDVDDEKKRVARLWEDTIVIALRDAQWLRCLDLEQSDQVKSSMLSSGGACFQACTDTSQLFHALSRRFIDRPPPTQVREPAKERAPNNTLDIERD